MPTARCESCKSSFETEGTTAVCPLCGQPAEVDLSVRVICSCGTTLKAPPKMRGRVIACPRCTRPVPIPRGNEAEEEQQTVQVGRKTRWVFALALLPLFVAIQGDRDNPRARVDRSLANYKVDASTAATLPEKVRLIPGGRAERAAIPQGSPMPWVYGAAGLALVLAFVGLSFGTPTLKTSELAVGAGVMALAGLGFGFVLYMVLPPPAGAESTPRILGLAVLSAAGSELLKSAWVAMRRGRLPMRALLLLGLAAGAGFGAGYAIQAGITFSGVARARSYWMEFVTLIAMQSVWSGIAALFVARGRNSRSSTGARIFAAAGVPIALHALFVFFHRQDLFLGSIVIGLISFALFHALHYWTEQTDQEVVAGETIRV